MQSNSPYSQFPQQTQQTPSRVPQRRTSRLAIIVASVFGLLFLSCSGLVGVFVYSIQARNEMSTEFKENRTDINLKPSRRMAQILAKDSTTEAKDKSLCKDVEEFFRDSTSWNIDEDEEIIDYDRMVQEMAQCGQAQGVNNLTHRIHKSDITGLSYLPFSLTVVLGAEWLIPDKEARATVVSYNDYIDQPDAYFVYLIRDKEEWKIYDWRDVLSPVSEAQYFALYTRLPNAMDDYVELSIELDEIDGDYEIENPERAARTLDAFRKYDFPSDIQPLARCLVAGYLSRFGEPTALHEFARGMDTSSGFAPAYYKARANYLQDNKLDAFNQLVDSLKELGWHPALTNLAGLCTTTKEQKDALRPYLLKSACTIPQHSPTIQVFAKIATADDLRRIVDMIAAREDGLATLGRLAQSLGSHEDLLIELGEAVKEKPGFEKASDYVDLRLALEADRTRDVIELSARLMQEPHFDDKAFVHIETNFLYSATRPGMLRHAIRCAPDRNQLALHIRHASTQRWHTLDWAEADEFLRSIPELASDAETQLALARIGMELGTSGFEKYLELLQEYTDAFQNPDEDLSFLLSLTTLSANAVDDIEQAKSYLKVIDHPAALVCLGNSLLERDRMDLLTAITEMPAKLESSLERQATMDVLKTHKHYEVGNWREADAAISRAIKSEIENIPVDELDPFFDSVLYECETLSFSDLEDLRYRIACRTGNIEQLISRLVRMGEFSVESQDELIWALESLGDPKQAKGVARELIRSGNPELRFTASFINAKTASWEGDLAKAQETYAAIADEIPAFRVDNVLDSLFASKNIGEINEYLEALPELNVSERNRQLLVAMEDNAVEQFVQTFESESEYEYDAWYCSRARVAMLQKHGVWKAVTDACPISMDYYLVSNTAQGEVYSNSKFNELLQTFDSLQTHESTSELRLSELQELETSSFPGSTEVLQAKWSHQSLTGRLTAIAYEGRPRAVEEGSEFHKQIEDYDGTLILMLHTDQGITPMHSTQRTCFLSR